MIPHNPRPFKAYSAPKYLILDSAANFNEEVVDIAESIGIQLKRTSFPELLAERRRRAMVESYRRDLLDHVSVPNEHHLNRLMSE